MRTVRKECHVCPFPVWRIGGKGHVPARPCREDFRSLRLIGATRWAEGVGEGGQVGEGSRGKKVPSARLSFPPSRPPSPSGIVSGGQMLVFRVFSFA